MVDGAKYDGNLFLNAVKEGLKLLNPSATVEQSSSSSYQSVFPRAPVIYAEVAGHVSGGGVPALVPLQVTRVSVKVLAEANVDPLPSSISVRFKAGWFVEDQYTGYPVILAVPVGHQGTLVRYEMRVHGIGPAKLHKDELANCRPHSNNFYLVSLPPVKASYKGGTLAEVAVSYIQDFDTIDEERERYSFSVPLSIPTYVTSRRKETLQNEKIRVIFGCRGPGSIEDCVITSHPMIGIITGEKKQVFLRESDGYSNRDLECSFRKGQVLGEGSWNVGRESARAEHHLDSEKSLMEFSREDFEECVMQGLKVSHGLNLDIVPDDQVPCMLPRAPVAFAFITEGAAVKAADNVDLPAMIPLPMTKFSVKTFVHPGINLARVCFKANWSVRFVKPGHLCDILLAVPAPMASGNLGVLSTFRIEIPNCSKSDVKPCSTYEPMFDDVYFIERPQVSGGADVCAFFSFHVKIFPSTSGVFFFSIPLCFPFYTKGFYGDKQLQVPWFCFSEEKQRQEEARFSGSPFKIKVFICATEGQNIRDYSCNFPLQAIMQYEDKLILLQELEGTDLEWPEGILTCSFSFMPKKATRCDRPTCENETVEPPGKRTCLGTGNV